MYMELEEILQKEKRNEEYIFLYRKHLFEMMINIKNL